MLPIANVFTNPKFVDFAQNTKAAITFETALKATGRPGFIMMDEELDEDTKKYAAAKEFLYQAICLAVYLTFIIPVFKKGTFKLFKNGFLKDVPDFKKFENAGQYLDYYHLADKNQATRLEEMKDNKKVKSLTDEMKKILREQKDPDKHSIIKGSIELSSIVGSVLGLAIFAPQVSHFMLHPILNFLGLGKKHDEKETKPAEKVPNINQVSQTNLDEFKNSLIK